MSCTNEDDQVEWMKDTEEKAPYCAEFDDYHDESREVLNDQGKAFPRISGMNMPRLRDFGSKMSKASLSSKPESVPH